VLVLGAMAAALASAPAALAGPVVCTSSIEAPLAGSAPVEVTRCGPVTTTAELMERAWALIEEVEALGGMTKAIEAGLPKLRIEEAAAAKQARLDSVQDVLVGVNAFRAEDDTELEILEVDNRAVLASQTERLAALKAARDPNAVASALEALEAAARSGQGNLLDLSIQAARVRATLGEISDALERDLRPLPSPTEHGPWSLCPRIRPRRPAC